MREERGSWDTLMVETQWFTILYKSRPLFTYYAKSHPSSATAVYSGYETFIIETVHSILGYTMEVEEGAPGGKEIRTRAVVIKKKEYKKMKQDKKKMDGLERSS